MRGKQTTVPYYAFAERITPADAGKTPSIRHPAGGGRDHPRGCGENRGKARNRLHVLGITPADAGKTATGTAYEKEGRDHPRGCGENLLYLNHEDLQVGSPPRMRGKLYSASFAVIYFRITPADAGKTSQSRGLWRWRRDHPRGCGENAFFANFSRLSLGSPPRMRGKPDEVTAYQAEARITPADAGKTPTPERRVIKCKDHPRGCGENESYIKSSTHCLGSPPRMRGKRCTSLCL